MQKIRDRRADEQYFEEYIAKKDTSVDRLTDFIKKESQSETFNPVVYENLLREKKRLFVARYSAGEDLGALKQYFESLVPEFLKHWDRGVGVDLIDFISIAILFEADDETMRQIAEVSKELYISRTRKQDWLVNFLLHGRIPEIEYEGVPFALPKLYSAYQGIIESEKPEEELFLFVKRRWYTSRKVMAWWGSHLRLEDKCYFGYWTFEAAAVAKTLGLDDSTWNELVYYPYDLARYGKK